MAEEIKNNEVVAEEAAPVEKKKTTRKRTTKKAAEAKKTETKEIPEFKYRAATIKDFGVLKHMIITEETQRLSREENAIVFACDLKATKSEIKGAVQAIFGGKVKSVNTMHVLPKKRRVGRYVGKTNGYKKAIVRFDSSFDMGKIAAATAPEELKANEADEK